MLLDRLRGLLDQSEEILSVTGANNFEEISPQRIASSRALIFSWPLYVDGLPAWLLSYLETLAETIVSGHLQQAGRVYALVNCGFYEARLNLPAVRGLKLFAKTVNLNWGQALALGGGGMYSSLPSGVAAGPWPFGRLTRALKILGQNIKVSRSGEDLLVEPSLPPWLYAFMANQRWRLMALKAGVFGKLKDKCPEVK
jgi:hypothetical protein